jgi:hypothetical protein
VARIVHRPSFAQRYETLWELVENGHHVNTSLVAIVMSVLFSAVVAMSEAQVWEISHTSREEMKDSLQLGTEAALGKANLVRSTKIETLQAFVTYLVRVFNNFHGFLVLISTPHCPFTEKLSVWLKCANTVI